MKVIATAAALAALALPAAAQDFESQLKARQGQMRIMALNLGMIGDMAKGETDYDAEAAQHAADSVVAISMVHQPTLWPAGTSEMDLEGTRAKPDIWDNYDKFLGNWQTLGEKAAALQEVAGNGKDALGPALGPLGGACKACHDDFRAPRN